MRRPALSILPAALLAMATSVVFAQVDTPPPATSPETIASEVDRELERVLQDLRGTEAELERVRLQNDVVRRRMIARGRAYYRLRHAGLLPLGAGFEKLMDHTSKLERLRTSLEKDARLATALNQRQLLLQDQRRVLVDRKVPLEIKRKAMTEARTALMEADDRKRAFDRAFSLSGGGEYMAVYGAGTDPSGPAGPDDVDTPVESGFASFRGQLSLPLAGRAEVRPVRRPDASGPGLEMLAPAGTPVRSVFHGRVAFADEYASYGRVVILDHGNQYFTVSGNLATVDVRVGEEISSGARIGTVGRSGNTGMLYFELRHGTDTLDPSPWMGL